MQKQATTASCKTSGGKKLGDGRGEPPSSMLGTIIGSDLTWNGSKGCRSKSRRANKSVLKGCGKLVNKKPETLDMPVSESEKVESNVKCSFAVAIMHLINEIISCYDLTLHLLSFVLFASLE